MTTEIRVFTRNKIEVNIVYRLIYETATFQPTQQCKIHLAFNIHICINWI